jgi:hypothetical protein
MLASSPQPCPPTAAAYRKMAEDITADIANDEARYTSNLKDYT